MLTARSASILALVMLACAPEEHVGPPGLAGAECIGGAYCSGILECVYGICVEPVGGTDEVGDDIDETTGMGSTDDGGTTTTDGTTTTTDEGEADSSCPTGSEGCPCHNGLGGIYCDAGLECVDLVCEAPVFGPCAADDPWCPDNGCESGYSLPFDYDYDGYTDISFCFIPCYDDYDCPNDGSCGSVSFWGIEDELGCYFTCENTACNQGAACLSETPFGETCWYEK